MICYNQLALHESRSGDRRRNCLKGRGGGKSEHYRAASQLTAGRLSAFMLTGDDKCNREKASQRAA